MHLTPFVVAVLGILSPTTTTAARANRRRQGECDSVCQTDRLLFESSMNDFLAAKAVKQPASLDWEDNGCSMAPDRPIGYDFLHSCQRHDFGYRNYQKQRRFTEEQHEKLDDQFRQDLYDECGQYERTGTRERARQCRRIANIYYVAVRELSQRSREGPV